MSSATPHTPVPVAGPKQQAWFRALDHARLTGAKPTYHLGKDYYTVLSPRAGDIYRVDPVITGCHLTYSCTCPASVSGKVCWHKALVAALPYEKARREIFRRGQTACRTCGQLVGTVRECNICELGVIPAFGG